MNQLVKLLGYKYRYYEFAHELALLNADHDSIWKFDIPWQMVYSMNVLINKRNNI